MPKPNPRKPRPPIVKLGKNGMRYVPMGTMPKAIPKGLRLVHNFEPGYPNRPLGLGGFRAYFEKADAKGVPRRYLCRCGWAPHLRRHYDADAQHQKGKH